jgi:hypothetical protein
MEKQKVIFMNKKQNMPDTDSDANSKRFTKTVPKTEIVANKTWH